MKQILTHRGSANLVLALGMISWFAAPAAAQNGEVSDPTARAVGEQLVDAFSADSPFTPDAPDHLWLDNDDGTYLFLHFDRPLAEATRLIYMGWAVPGRWCAEDRPGEEFTHFHRLAEVGDWNAGHGGSEPGERGYWLKHVAVDEFEMPAMMGMPERTVPAGADREFMPTRAPSCGG